MSSSLPSAKKKYSQLEKKALAIIFRIKKFIHTFMAKVLQFTLIINHSCPVPVMVSLHIQQLAMMLGCYHCSISYKPGNIHDNADWLSILPLLEVPGHLPMPANVVLLQNQKNLPWSKQG